MFPFLGVGTRFWGGFKGETHTRRKTHTHLSGSDFCFEITPPVTKIRVDSAGLLMFFGHRRRLQACSTRPLASVEGNQKDTH